MPQAAKGVLKPSHPKLQEECRERGKEAPPPSERQQGLVTCHRGYPATPSPSVSRDDARGLARGLEDGTARALAESQVLQRALSHRALRALGVPQPARAKTTRAAATPPARGHGAARSGAQRCVARRTQQWTKNFRALVASTKAEQAVPIASDGPTAAYMSAKPLMSNTAYSTHLSSSDIASGSNAQPAVSHGEEGRGRNRASGRPAAAQPPARPVQPREALIPDSSPGAQRPGDARHRRARPRSGRHRRARPKSGRHCREEFKRLYY